MQKTTRSDSLHHMQIQAMDRLKQKADELKKQGVYIEPYEVKRHLVNQLVINKMQGYQGNNPKKYKAIVEVISQAEIEREYPSYNSDGNQASIDFYYSSDIGLNEPENVKIKVLAKRIYENAMNNFLNPQENYKKSKTGL